jgi:hypothetical protein
MTLPNQCPRRRAAVTYLLKAWYGLFGAASQDPCDLESCGLFQEGCMEGSSRQASTHQPNPDRRRCHLKANRKASWCTETDSSEAFLGLLMALVETWGSCVTGRRDSVESASPASSYCCTSCIDSGMSKITIFYQSDRVCCIHDLRSVLQHKHTL